MQITKFEEFRDELVRTGSYHTDPGHRAEKRAKPGAWTTYRLSKAIFDVFPLCALYEPIGKLTTERWGRFCFRLIQRAEALGMKVEVDGFSERIAYKGPVMYLCNHMSTVETILLPPILMAFGPFSFVAKASLAHLPFLERAADHMRMVPIGRKSPREDLMKLFTVGAERIGGGDSFLIFPQGTRELVFDRKGYSSIGAKLAEKAGCPVVPIVVDTRCQLTREKGLFRKVFHDFGSVDTSYDLRVACGPVIPCGKSRDLHNAAFDWMADKLESWKMPVVR